MVVTSIELKAAAFSELREEYLSYAAGLRLADTYWEDVVLEAGFYRILADGEPAGCCSVCSRAGWEEEGYLTSFFLKPERTRWAKPAMEAVLERLRPKGAFAVSCDEPYLSLCCDYAAAVRPQACFFDYEPREPVKPPAFPASRVRRAAEADLPDLEASGFYRNLDLCDEENRLYVLREEDGTYLGTGHIARMRLNRSWGAVGMCTAPAQRRRGAGRSIILALTHVVREEGLIPIAGCNWYNTASRATLESCGFVSRTRFLKFGFETPGERSDRTRPDAGTRRNFEKEG